MSLTFWRLKMKITMTSIFVDDPIKAHKFFTEVLGFETKEFVADAQLAVVVTVLYDLAGRLDRCCVEFGFCHDCFPFPYLRCT